MFSYFIQQWKEEPSPQLIFFSDCMKYQKLFGFSSVPNDKRVPPKSSYPELLLNALNHSGTPLDSSVPLCDYAETIQDLLHIFYSSRRQLTLSQISQRRKYRETKIRKEEGESDSAVLENIVEEDMSCMNLTDRSLGPLVLPGPCTNTPPSTTSLNTEEPHLERGSSITQHQIWPDLDPLKFAIHDSQTSSQRGLRKLLSIASNIHSQVATLPLFSLSDLLRLSVSLLIVNKPQYHFPS
jgi:hypothetical protein